jgi:multiple sugar transport system ATP-binding protein
MTMGTRIAVMTDGLLQQVGTPQSLYDTPVNRFVAGFIGSPAMNFVDMAVRGAGDGATLEGADFNLPLPARLRGSVGPTSGRRLVAGIRPEHLDIGAAGEGAAVIQVKADVVEYLGNEELLHVTIGTKELVAVVGAEHRVRPGDIVDLVFPMDKLHLFDAETGAALASITPAATTAA